MPAYSLSKQPSLASGWRLVISVWVSISMAHAIIDQVYFHIRAKLGTGFPKLFPNLLGTFRTFGMAMPLDALR